MTTLDLRRRRVLTAYREPRRLRFNAELKNLQPVSDFFLQAILFGEGVPLSMADRIDERDMCLFWELYDVLACFADDPQNSISRIGGGRISVPDDQANHLDHFLRAILEIYPDAAGLGVVRVAKEIDAIFGCRSLGGEAFDEVFWTNAGFQRHEDWLRIRELARAVLIR